MRQPSKRWATVLKIAATAALLWSAPPTSFHGVAFTREQSVKVNWQRTAEPKGKPSKGKIPEETRKDAPTQAAPRPDYESILKNLRWREIGPATMGGRIDDFAVVESNPNIVYVGTASGGIFRTTTAGTTWEPIFDNEAVSTIGDLAIAPSDPSIVWAGTGEPNNRQSSSWGNGVYKSTDGGKTWQLMGLKETHHIGRVVIHPSDPNTAYVAAAGRLWGPSKERGVYKTTDGGKTWSNVLFINEDTGVIDIAIDRESPGTLYAAAYQRRRTVFGFNGSGPHGGIYKTTDGGANWKKLEKGLPWDPNPPRSSGGQLDSQDTATAAPFGFQTGQQPTPQAQQPAPGPQEIGRIGLNIYRGNPNIVYAIIEHGRGGVFRSEDKGETWTKMSDTNPRPMYYSKIHIDPNNDQRIWVLGASMYYSDDGGRTFRTNVVQRIHGDFHAMWINPANSDHMIVGSDGGIHWSYDRGRSWDFVNTIPLAQFYEIGVDMRKPYYICGGLQDNNTWCGPSATMDFAGISNAEWFTIGGGDGFYAQIDPTDPNIVYAESQDGNLLRRDLRTHESRSIRPQPLEGEPRYRFQWNSPLVISAHDPKTIYYGGNFLFKSTDRGDSWTKISPDLTTGQERDKLPIMGKVPDKNTLSRHDGVQQWPAITSISESPLNAALLWVGTDDGNLQVTRDGGKTWKNAADRMPGVPKSIYVSRVIASRHAESTAYVTFDGHRSNDFNIYVFMTLDCGETWKAIRNGLPDNNGVVNVVREHHRNPKLLFAGTEYGAYVSFDQGANWTKFKMNLPTVPVDDIAIHPRENDLIFATHGRSIWILDDITPLEQLTEQAVASDLELFAVRPATLWRLANRTSSASTGHKVFRGQNPANGAIIQYYLKKKIEPPRSAQGSEATQDGQEQARPQGRSSRTGVKITILDSEGKTVRELDGTAEPGINRVVWDLRTRSPIPPAPAELETGSGFGFGRSGSGGFGFGGAATGSRVDPGNYTVKISVANTERTKTVAVEEDPRVAISAADRAARRQALNQLAQMIGPATVEQRSITSLRTSLSNTMETWKRPGAPRVVENVKKATEDLLKKADEVCRKFASPSQCSERPTEGSGSAGPPLAFAPPAIPQRISQLMFAIEGYTAAPTAWQLEQIKLLSGMLQEASAPARKLMQEELPALNKLMNEAGIPHVTLGPPRGRLRVPPRDELEDDRR